MIVQYDDITPAALAGLGCEDPERCCRVLQDMAGHDVPDSVFEGMLRNCVPAIAACADPDRAVINLGRWADRVGNRISSYSLLAAYPAAASILITVMAASQYFSDLIIQHPELLEILTNPRIRDRSRDKKSVLDDLTRRVGIARTPGGQKDALRRQKPAEILRIGARDILNYADFETTIRDITAFADAAITAALTICAGELGVSDPAFAVFALGKLGGEELNYSSDIDLIYVHADGPLSFDPNRLGEAVRSALDTVTESGFIFRVDLRLRPEGRFGPVSRSLESCRAYYESWAEPWERQALMKARFVAGDVRVGAAFTRIAEEFVYPKRMPDSFLDDIRHNKRRLETKIQHAGEAHSNVKEGYGGIRDIEFTVQLLQLTLGGANPQVRTGNTLEALQRLLNCSLITEPESTVLRESYIFLRVVEHRLQILDEQAIRCLPLNEKERSKLARRLGYADGKAFDREYIRHTERVHALLEELFYGVRADTAHQTTLPQETVGEMLLAQDDPEEQAALLAALVRLGFARPGEARNLLNRDIEGSEYGGISPEARSGFVAIVGTILDAAAATPDPDQALHGLNALAEAVPSRAALFRSLADSPRLLSRLCVAAAGGPALWQTLLSHLEYFDLIANPEEDSPPEQQVPTSPEAIARYCLRTRLWTGFRDLWAVTSVEEVMFELTEAADSALNAAIAIAKEELAYTGQFAVVGMGKYGGAELGYGSDLDVLYVSDGAHVGQAARMADRVQKILRDELAQYGIRFDIDARLRPDGRKGALALNFDSYAKYYRNGAAAWEKHALIKARPAAGDRALGEHFRALRDEILFQAPASEATVAEIREMKKRIEKERLKSKQDIKLAHGGLTDIEWTVQLLQLRHGARRPALRCVGTVQALRVLRDDALITQDDWSILYESYCDLTRLRNHLYLIHGVGVNSPAELPEALRTKMAAVRSIVERLFYQ